MNFSGLGADLPSTLAVLCTPCYLTVVTSALYSWFCLPTLKLPQCYKSKPQDHNRMHGTVLHPPHHCLFLSSVVHNPVSFQAWVLFLLNSVSVVKANLKLNNSTV